MSEFQSDSSLHAPPLGALLVCSKCGGPRRIEMKTPVALTDDIVTVTLACDPCGTMLVEICSESAP
jgi:hypothetical protein